MQEIQLKPDNVSDVEAFMQENKVEGTYDNGFLTIEGLVGNLTATAPSWLVVGEGGEPYFVADEDHDREPVDPGQWDVDTVDE